jgi:hypothetical protein
VNVDVRGTLAAGFASALLASPAAADVRAPSTYSTYDVGVVALFKL